MEKPDHVAWQEDAKDADASEKKEYAEEVSPGKLKTYNINQCHSS